MSIAPFTPDPQFHFPYPLERSLKCVKTSLETQFAENLLLNKECIRRIDRSLLKSWARITIAYQPHHNWLQTLLESSKELTLNFDHSHTVYSTLFTTPVTCKTLWDHYKSILITLDPLPTTHAFLQSYLQNNAPYSPLLIHGFFSQYLKAFLSHLTFQILHSEPATSPVFQTILTTAEKNNPETTVYPIELSQSYYKYKAGTKLALLHSSPLPAKEQGIKVDCFFNGLTVSRLDTTHYKLVESRSIPNKDTSSNLLESIKSIYALPYSIAVPNYKELQKSLTELLKINPSHLKSVFCTLFDLTDCVIYKRTDGLPLALKLSIEQEESDGPSHWHTLRITAYSIIPLLPIEQSWGTYPTPRLDHLLSFLDNYPIYYDPSAKADFTLLSLVHPLKISGGESSLGVENITLPELDYCLEKLTPNLYGTLDKQALLSGLTLPTARKTLHELRMAWKASQACAQLKP
jgi:hypothetical protein